MISSDLEIRVSDIVNIFTYYQYNSHTNQIYIKSYSETRVSVIIIANFQLFSSNFIMIARNIQWYRRISRSECRIESISSHIIYIIPIRIKSFGSFGPIASFGPIGPIGHHWPIWPVLPRFHRFFEIRPSDRVDLFTYYQYNSNTNQNI